MKYKYIFGFTIIAVLFVILPHFVKASSFNLSTGKTTFAIGDTFSVYVRIDSPDTGINAAQATIQFPKGVINVTGLDKTASVFSFWLQDPAYSNDNGTISFIGGSTSGFAGKSLEALKINFKVVGAGSAEIVFTDGAITASDGSGTNVLDSMKGIQIASASKQEIQAITPPPVVQITRPAVPTGRLPIKPVVNIPFYPDSNSWYNVSSNFIVRWNLPNDVTGVATAIDKNPSTNSTASEGLFDNKNFEGLSDGVWYLHIRFKNDVGWGPTLNYKISIDTVPPTQFTAVVKEGNNTDVITPTLEYQSSDPIGVSYYKIIVDSQTVTSTVNTAFTLPPQGRGNHSVIVQAFDLAGNRTESRINLYIQEKPFFVIGGFGVSQTLFFVVIIVLIILGAAAGWYAGQLEKKKRQMRIVIAQRDVVTSFNLVTKEIDSLLTRYADNKIDEQEAEEIKFALKRLKEEADKIKNYVSSNIEEING